MKRTASAAWTGGLQKGAGTISTQSGALATARYGFKERIEGGPGTNPEELIAAALAGCFSMALVALLEQEEMTPNRLQTEAAVSFDKVDGGFLITAIHLELVADVPQANQADLARIANIAKRECPISKLLNAPITLSVKLENEETP